MRDVESVGSARWSKCTAAHTALWLSPWLISEVRAEAWEAVMGERRDGCMHVCKYACRIGVMGVGGWCCRIVGRGHFLKGKSLHWFFGGDWACGGPSMQQPINDTVRGRQRPGSRLANDYSDLVLEWGRSAWVRQRERERERNQSMK